jgi:hypothetical protein
MTIHTPLWVQPVVGDVNFPSGIPHDAQLLRQGFGALIDASSFPGEQGVIGNYMQVQQRGAGANFSVDITSGRAFVQGDDVSNQGRYTVWSDATYNLAVPSAPASGTRVHRIVLQIQDQLNNGVWTGYTAAFTCLADTGTGTPAEPNSAITLAYVSVAAGQGSVLNANITDMRQAVGRVWACKPADTTRTNTATVSDDPDLNLNDLQVSATYAIDGFVAYDSTSAAGWRGQFRVVGGGALTYSALHVYQGGASTPMTHMGQVDTDSVYVGADVIEGLGQHSAWTPVAIRGQLITGTAAPQALVLQWAAWNSGGGNTIVKKGAWLEARRVA